MRLHFVLLLSGLLAAACSKQTGSNATGARLLDEPVHGKSGGDLIARLMELDKRLPEEDRVTYEIAVSDLYADYTQKVCASFSSDEKAQAFLAAFDGITPRQVILLGMALHTEICMQPDRFEETLTGMEKEQRREHMLEHLRIQQDATLWALRKYSGLANQAADRMPGSNVLGGSCRH